MHVPRVGGIADALYGRVAISSPKNVQRSVVLPTLVQGCRLPPKTVHVSSVRQEYRSRREGYHFFPKKCAGVGGFADARRDCQLPLTKNCGKCAKYELANAKIRWLQTDALLGRYASLPGLFLRRGDEGLKNS